MFPNATFLTIDLYTWMIILGVVVAVVIFRLLADKRKVSAKVFNFALAVGVCCVAVGYGSAVLFQAFYHWLDTGEWVWNAGATFYGGLIGAAVVFLAAYFGIGHFIFRDKKHITELTNVLNCIFPAIIAAHCFGRIGCLFAGCCYGKLTDSWMGITMWIPSAHAWQKRLPTQLFEAIFLAVLFAVVAPMVLCQSLVYKLSYFAKLKNAFMLSMRQPLVSFGLLVGNAAPWLLLLIDNKYTFMAFLVLLPVVVMPAQLIADIICCDIVLDKYVNKDNFPQIYRKGLNYDASDNNA